MLQNLKYSDSGVDVVLIQLPFWGVGCPPLALGILKSYLKEHDISCEIMDVNAHLYTVKGKKYLEHWHVKNGYNFCMERDHMLEFYADNRALMLYYMDNIRKLNPLIVGCSVQVTSRIITELFLEDLRKNSPGYNHIVGGPEVAHFMKNTNTLLSHDFIDAVNQDEGENSFVDYVNAIKNDTGKPVPGMVYKRKGKIIQGPPSNYINKLDELPFAEFTGLNLKYYNRPNTLPTYSTRGCVNKCNYCSAIGFMTNDRYPFRLRTAQRMFDEINYFKSKYPNLCEVRMCDNISNSKIRNLEQFCDLMIESGMNKKVIWSLENAVIRKEMRKPLYKKLKKAGCTLLGYGMETPSVRLLHDVGKTLATHKDVDLPAILSEGKKEGLIMSVNVMFGLPTETEEDFNFLMEFLRDNKKAFSMVNPSLNFCEYYPGSAGNANPEKHNVDLSKGTLFWDSLDGKNTYLTRMERFEKFCKVAKEFKLDNLFDVQELPNKHKLLFEYFFICKDVENCIIEFKQIDDNDITEDIIVKYEAITTGNYSDLGKYNNKEIAQLSDYVGYSTSFEQTYINENLSPYLDDFLENKPYDTENSFKLWKKNLRQIGLFLSGYNYIHCLINDIISSFNNIDKIITDNYSTFNKTEFNINLIKEELTKLKLLSEKINKRNKNIIYKFFDRLSGTYYFSNKIKNLLNCFCQGLYNKNYYEGIDTNVNQEFNCYDILENLTKINNNDDDMYYYLMKTSVLNKPFEIYSRIIGHKQCDKRIITIYSVMQIITKKIGIVTDKETPQIYKKDKIYKKDNKINIETLV